MNKFIRQNFARATCFKTLVNLGCFAGDLDKILQRYGGKKKVYFLGGLFFIWQIALYGNALSHGCTKLRNHNFVSKFTERIEDNTL